MNILTTLRRAIACLSVATLPLSAMCSDTDTRTLPIDERVGALRVYPEGDDMLPPVVTLGSGRGIEVSFDLRDDDRRYLRYSLTHCNADWLPDGLVDSEFLDGFNDAEVEDYAFSDATTVPYVHYRILLPNDRMAPRLSGNYLLTIYEDGHRDTPIAQARFSLSEGSAVVGVKVSGVTDIDYLQSNQQLEIEIDGGKTLTADDLNNRLIVKVRQNSREDDVRTLTRPQYADARGSDGGLMAHYAHLPQLIFPAGNEYRRFETVSTDRPGMRVDDVQYIHPYYHFKVTDDAPRSQYTYDRTQGGRYRVRELNAAEPNTGADYAIVHFALNLPELPGADIYIDGDLFNRRLDSSSRMRYDTVDRVYRLASLLKQGSYNYQYLVVPQGKTSGASLAPIEGNYAQTANEYRVDVYYRAPGARYDRLIGSTTVKFDH